MSRGFAVATQGRAGSHLYGTSGVPAVAASGTWMCARVLLVLRRWPPRITAVVASWRWRLAALCGLDVERRDPVVPGFDELDRAAAVLRIGADVLRPRLGREVV